VLDDQKILSEQIILNLRCSRGFELSAPISAKYGSVITMLMNKKLLERRSENIRLTRTGMLLANQVMKEFI